MTGTINSFGQSVPGRYIMLWSSLGKEATFYDGMITCSTIPGKAVCKAVWNMGVEDWFIDHLYTPKGFFTPPFDTVATLYKRLSKLYESVELETVESMACFTCRKHE